MAENPENLPGKSKPKTLDELLSESDELNNPDLTIRENVGIDDDAAAVAETVAENAELDGVKPPSVDQAKPSGDGGGRPAWHSEPLANFETDKTGKVKLRSNGEPIRRPGRPRKASPGDALAGGGTMPKAEPLHLEVRRVVDPLAEQGDGGAATPATTTMGPEAGPVLVELMDNTAKAIGGKVAGMTSDERKSMDNAAGQFFNGRTMRPVLALALFMAAWLSRVWIQKHNDKKKTNEHHTRDDHRREQDRKDNAGQAAVSGGGDAVDWIHHL